MRAVVNTNRKVFGNYFQTLATLLRGILGRNFNYCTPSFFRFDVQDVKELKPSNVSHTPSQLCKTCEGIHFLVTDSIIVINVMLYNLVMKIKTLIRNFLVNFRKQEFGLFTFPRTLDLFCKFLRKRSDTFLGLVQPSGVFNFKSVRVCDKTFTPNINTNRPINWFKNLGVNIITRKTNIPFTVSFTNSYSFNFSTERNLSVKFEFEDTKFFNSQDIIFQNPTCLFQGQGIISIKTFESWKSRSLSFLNSTKEIQVGFIKTFNNILECLGGNLFKFGVCFFKFTELVCLVIARNKTSKVFVGVNTLFKTKVVNLTAKFKDYIGLFLCCLIDIGSEFVCLFHVCSPIDSCSIRQLKYTLVSVKSQGKNARSVSHTLKGWGFRPSIVYKNAFFSYYNFAGKAYNNKYLNI